MQIVQSSGFLKLLEKITLQLRQSRWLPPATESFQACSSCCSSALFSPALQLSACKRGLDGRSSMHAGRNAIPVARTRGALCATSSPICSAWMLCSCIMTDC